jgi:GTP-binding protein HflX
MRALDLPHGAKIILSDTVGFISDLPTTLVAAFRATLEEVVAADVILHVRDVSHEDSEAQSQDVETVMRQLGIEPGEQVIEVWNKIDRLDAQTRERLGHLADRAGRRAVAVSALTGEGMERLLGEIEGRIASTRIVLDLLLDGADGAGISWLHRNTEVLAKAVRDDGSVAMTVRADKTKAATVRARFGA